MGPLRFYWECLKLAWGAAAWTRAVNGTLGIFLPIFYFTANTDWLRQKVPNAFVWLQQQPGWVTWLPLIMFSSFFVARSVCAPYWLYRDKKPQETRKVGKEQADTLARLFRNGQELFERRIDQNFQVAGWINEVKIWGVDVFLELEALDPGEAFAFESIGFEHRQNQDQRVEARYASAKAQLEKRLNKLRLVTGRYLGASLE